MRTKIFLFKEAFRFYCLWLNALSIHRKHILQRSRSVTVIFLLNYRCHGNASLNTGQ